MPMNGQLNPDALYQQGLQYFNRGEWQAAITTLTELRGISSDYPGVDALLADARLKLQFEGADQPTAMAPPRKSFVMPLLMAIAVCLLAIGGYFGFQWITMDPPSVAAIEMPTAVPPTATARPPEPTAEPTVRPTATPMVPGTVAIKAAPGENFVSAPANIQIILDASGSMLADVSEGGPERWQVAQDALHQVLDSGVLPLESYVGVRTYGRNRSNDCKDLEVALPLEPYSYERVLGVVDKIRPVPYGMTPLGASLSATTQDLAQVSGSTAVILITDGIESCDGDPVAEAAKLIEAGPDRKVHVIGFAIDDPEASAKLREIAVQGNGLYFDANDSTQLAESLRQAVVVSFTITTPSGEEVASGNIGDAPMELKPGRYRFRVNGTSPIDQDFVVKNGAPTEILLSQIGGGLGVQVSN